MKGGEVSRAGGAQRGTSEKGKKKNRDVEHERKLRRSPKATEVTTFVSKKSVRPRGKGEGRGIKTTLGQEWYKGEEAMLAPRKRGGRRTRGRERRECKTQSLWKDEKNV